MISLDSLRKVDTSSTQKMSDEELTLLRGSIYDSTNLLFENWSKGRFSSKNPKGLLTINKNNI